jgi:DNA adenine methylase
MNSIGTVLKYPGAKHSIADELIALFPPRYHSMTYLEPFFGSGAVLFRKTPSAVETLNDRDNDVYNLFLQIRERPEELARLIAFTPYSREEYELSYVPASGDLEKARRFLIRMWFTIGSSLRCRNGWRNNVKKNNGSIGTFYKLPETILFAAERLRAKPGNHVQIENRDAFRLIETYNRKTTFMYLDPPYVLETRKNRKIYSCEFTDDDHARLIQFCNSSKAKILLSGYDSPLYEQHLASHFRRHVITAVDEAGNTKREIAWYNYSRDMEMFE